MRRKLWRQYTAVLKTKVVLEVLKNEKIRAEIATEYKVLPQSINSWKKIFLENAEIAMDPSKTVKKYKEEKAELRSKEKRNTKLIGKLTIEKEWVAEKLESLDSINKLE
ncbi:MAG: hypothetical protein NTX05_05470 [Fusobacteria bacterium]|nr:hypothetical protein [Fusobacteriota bacterium]